MYFSTIFNHLKKSKIFLNSCKNIEKSHKNLLKTTVSFAVIRKLLQNVTGNCTHFCILFYHSKSFDKYFIVGIKKHKNSHENITYDYENLELDEKSNFISPSWLLIFNCNNSL